MKRLKGQHDVDKGWMSEVAQNGAKIVPRLIFEKFHPSQLVKMLKQEVLLKSIAKTMVDLTVKHGLDGLTIEIWNSIREQEVETFFQLFLKLSRKNLL